MPKKLLLDFEDEIMYSIIGISSSMKDYKLVFNINKIQNYDFKRKDPFLFKFNDEDYKYSVYLNVNEQDLLNYYLISNSCEAVKLLSKYKHFDYLLVIEGEIDDDVLSEISMEIKRVKGVMMTSIIDAEILNSIPNLRIMIEQHFDKIISKL